MKGFSPSILLFTCKEFKKALSQNPFVEDIYDPKKSHLFFLDNIPQEPNLELLERVRANTEKFKLIGSTFYLYATDGVGRSKLVAGIEKALGVSVTARNWRTVNKIISMVTKAYTSL